MKYLLSVILVTASMNLFACTIIAVGKKASADGSVIVSHTDCGADNRIRVVHGQSYKKGVQCNSGNSGFTQREIAVH